MIVRSVGLATLTAGLVTIALVASCSGSRPDNGFGNGDDTDGATASLGGDASSGQLNDDGGGSVSIGDAACAAAKTIGQQLPLDMYIMLDQSGSMNDPVAGGGTKWSAISAALSSFVSQPNLNGISVGLQYFGVPATSAGCPSSCSTNTDCGSSGPCFFSVCLGCALNGGADSCNAADYAKADVEIGALPGVGSAITASIGKHGPNTSTPTSAALQGAVDHATAWAKAHTSDAVIAVLATDGDPTECDTNLANINAIAAAGVSGTPKILTFVIGVGASLTNLNGIAAAGGTKSAFFVDTNANANQQFLAALNQIRGTVLGCTYKIPMPQNGTPDYSRVNVQYVPGSGGAPQVIPQVQGKASCPASGNAWYYDNAANPTQIILCDATCTAITADTKAEIDVLTGCETIVR